MTIEQCSEQTKSEWLRLRALLWPDATAEEHQHYVADMLRRPEKYLALLARPDGGEAVGFAEGSLREDYVNGCDTNPVIFLEGIYVEPENRLQGIARALSTEIEKWGVDKNCTEFASDAEVWRTDSHKMHEALGFEEMERVVYFKKMLPSA